MAQSERGLPTIVKMLSAADADVRCSAMWAFSHLVNGARPAVCEAVMAALPWDHFSLLLQDADSAVQVHSATLAGQCCVILAGFALIGQVLDAVSQKLLQDNAVQFAAAGLLFQGPVQNV